MSRVRYFHEDDVKFVLNSYGQDPYFINEIIYQLKQLQPNVSTAAIERELMECYEFFRAPGTFAKPIHLTLEKDVVHSVLDEYTWDPFFINDVIDKLQQLQLNPNVGRADIERELMDSYDFFRTPETFVRPIHSILDKDVVESILKTYGRDPSYYDHIIEELQRFYPNVSEADIERELLECSRYAETSFITPKSKKRRRAIITVEGSTPKKLKHSLSRRRSAGC